MDATLLVSVFVPTTDDHGADHGGEQGAIGTGYPVGADLILTSRHVVRQTHRDRRYPIEIRWWGLPEEDEAGRVSLPIGNQEDDWVVWEGTDELDVVLLRCPRPTGIGRSYGIVSGEKPNGDMIWKGHGFPEAGVYDDDRRAVGFRGHVYPDPNPENPFELSVEANPLEGKWGGASGMPVFVNQGILGVVRKRPPNYQGKRLLAVPSWKLLEDEAFRDAIGVDCQENRRKKFQESLEEILEASKKAMAMLVEELGLSDEADVDTLCVELLAQDFDRLIKGLRAAHRRINEDIQKRPSEELLDARQALVDVALLVLPALYDQGVISWVRSRDATAEAAFLELPVGVGTVAEIIMAAWDDREASYQQRLDARHYPEGELSLGHAPEGGMDSPIAERVAAIQDHLAKKFGDVDPKAFHRDIDGYLAARFFMPEAGMQTSDEERKAFVAAQIEGDTEDSGRRFYMVFRIQGDTAVREDMEAFIRQLKEDYPAVIFLLLPNDNTLALRDRKRFDPFVRMLPTQGS